MKRLCLLLSAVLCAAVCAVAQPAPTSPPNVLLIVREDIKPGKMPAHEQEAAAYISVLRKANARLAAELRDGRIAMSPVAGNENEVAYLWAYDSLAAMEQHHMEMDKLTSGVLKADFDALPDRELHAAQRDIVAGYRADLSHGIGNVDVPQARYMVMTTLRLKPGHETEYWDAFKRIIYPARDKAGLKGSWAVYQVRAGLPAPTFIVFRPVRSLAELDIANPLAMRAAMGNDADDMDKATDRSVVGSDTVYYRFNPRISLVAPEFAARDTAAPAFWNPTAAPAAPTAARAGGQKRERKMQR